MEESNIIEVVKMLPISSDPKKAEFELNSMIYNIQHNHDITVHEDLCGAIDPYKFIFAFQENKDGSGDPTSSYGVLVIETAADYQETERRINDALDSMRSPVSIFEPIYNDGGDTIYLSDQLEDKSDNINSWDINIYLKDAIEQLQQKEKKILNCFMDI